MSLGQHPDMERSPARLAATRVASALLIGASIYLVLYTLGMLPGGAEMRPEAEAVADAKG